MSSTNRNAPCPCGSGKKYKQCCLKRDEALASEMRSVAVPSPASLNELVGLFHARRYAELEANARLLVGQFPHAGLAWKMLGAALQMQDKDALHAMQEAARLLPGDAEAHNNLGVVQTDLGQLDKAVASHRRALVIKPNFAEAHNNLGSALRSLGQLDDALASFNRALKLKPDYVNAHNNLGNTLRNLGRLDDARLSFCRALKLKPDYAKAHNNLGNVLSDLGQLDEAVVSYNRALELKPDYAEAHNNLGGVLRKLGQLDDARLSYRRALELEPDYAEAHNNLGYVLAEIGQLDDAIEHYRRALSLKPDFPDARANLLFCLNYHPERSAQEIYREYREFDQRQCLPLRSAWRAHDNDRSAERRLRVGYVSPDFRQHSVRLFLEPLLANHDKAQVEVYAYAELFVEDEMSLRYKSYADHWVPTKGMSDEALAERVRSDGIDILVDLAGHTSYNRLLTFARKPAPVSVSWLGYAYTTGVSAINYYLTDEICVPPGSEALFAEQPWRIATPAYVYRPAAGMGEVGDLPALRRGHITFGTLTRSVRINHRVIRVWSEILKAVHDSRLVIDSFNFKVSVMQERLAAHFAEHGIERERLSIGFHSPPWDVLRSTDIGLDCFPHNSGATLFETLYMGVPYITLAGRPSVGRLGSSILHGAGHPEWIATSEDDYVARAVELASDIPRLARVRAALRDEMKVGPLMDEAGFARKVEGAYRGMWKAWCEKGGDA